MSLNRLFGPSECLDTYGTNHGYSELRSLDSEDDAYLLLHYNPNNFCNESLWEAFCDYACIARQLNVSQMLWA
jgi:hypothetical protein